MLLDTCFLIDLHRELKADRSGDAQTFLQKHTTIAFSISVISATEFLEGFETTANGERFLRPFTWIPIDSSISREASRIRRHLRLHGDLIGDFDILIAATSNVTGLPLVTDNTAHFERVPDLRVFRYKPAANPGGC